MRKGFTLNELLIVIAIIGILAVVFLPSVLNSPAKARDTERAEEVKKLADFFTSEYVLTGKSVPATACLNPGNASDAVKAIKANLDKFSGIFPLDPLPGHSRCKNDDYLLIKDPHLDGTVPAGTYSFGIYIWPETFAAANAECKSAYAGTIKEPAENDKANWCYVILVQ
ncbi:type II secretion system protein [Candidatus Peregrinibacteria bacterium]|nr:type II secretion system protein [Candidatus Peregrinibacteria bacterium]